MPSFFDSFAQAQSLAAATRESFVELESSAGRSLLRGHSETATIDEAQGSAPLAPSGPTPAEASEVVAFWRAAGAELWFAKDTDFDDRFRARFLSLHGAAVRDELAHWPATPEGALALLLLLDQFPHNAFRGTPRMYASDALARHVASMAIDAGHDREVEPELQVFFYLPFGHSEDLDDQERSVALTRRLGSEILSHAEGHRSIVRRFGRFPHRNPILGRAMTREEQQFLDEGGYAG